MPRFNSSFILVCQLCGTTFTAARSHTRYCSQQCKNRRAEVSRQKRHTLMCDRCGDVFTHRHAHTRYCSKKCYHAMRYNEVVLTCRQCGKSFTPPKYGGRDEQPYCSRRCSGLARQARIAKTCQQCGATFTVSPAFDHLKHCSKACSVATQQEQAEQNAVTKACEHCGKVFTVPAGRKHYKYCSRSCNRARHGETSIERAVREALDCLGIAYQQEHQVSVYCLDFYLPACRVALEVDGDYWHGLPSAIERDARRDQYLAQQGITTVRIHQYEIDEHVVELVKHRLAPYAQATRPYPQQLSLPLP